MAGIFLKWKLMEYTSDHSLDTCIIPAFQNKFLELKLQQIFSGKIAFKLISANVLQEKYVPKINTKETKPKQIQ